MVADDDANMIRNVPGRRSVDAMRLFAEVRAEPALSVGAEVADTVDEQCAAGRLRKPLVDLRRRNLRLTSTRTATNGAWGRTSWSRIQCAQAARAAASRAVTITLAVELAIELSSRVSATGDTVQQKSTYFRLNVPIARDSGSPLLLV
jgi:hypothetical protein